MRGAEGGTGGGWAGGWGLRELGVCVGAEGVCVGSEPQRLTPGGWCWQEGLCAAWSCPFVPHRRAPGGCAVPWPPRLAGGPAPAPRPAPGCGGAGLRPCGCSGSALPGGD